MSETKAFILSSGKMVRTLIKTGIVYPLTPEGIARKLVNNTRWYNTNDVLAAVILNKDILEPYTVEPIEQKGIDPEEYISETALRLCSFHEKSLNVSQKLLLAELIML